MSSSSQQASSSQEKSSPATTTASAAASRRRVRPAPNWADKTLGCFGNVPPNAVLDHIIRYLSTWSGTDKALMVTQYGSKLVVPLLTLQHAIRLRLAGNKAYHAYKGGSANARRLEKLSSLISDARMLYRIWGLLPMIKWVSKPRRQRKVSLPSANLFSALAADD